LGQVRAWLITRVWFGRGKRRYSITLIRQPFWLLEASHIISISKDCCILLTVAHWSFRVFDFVFLP
jgi:hypothetical protein